MIRLRLWLATVACSAVAALRAVTPSAGPPGTTITLILQGSSGKVAGLSSSYDEPMIPECAVRLAGATDCLAVVTVGRYVCRQDVDDAVAPIEFWPTSSAATGRYLGNQRLNCTMAAAGSNHGVDATAPSPEVGA